MKTPFIRNQKVLETCLDPGEEFEGDSATVTAYFIDENETDVMLYIDEENLGLPEEFKALNLTCDGILHKPRLKIEQKILVKYDENVVLLEKREGKLFTCLGYEIELKAFENGTK